MGVPPVYLPHPSSDDQEPGAKSVRLDPNEMRPETRTALGLRNKGDRVDVWSHGKQKWCPGVIKEFAGKKTIVDYVKDEKNCGRKELSQGSKFIRDPKKRRLAERLSRAEEAP